MCKILPNRLFIITLFLIVIYPGCKPDLPPIAGTFTLNVTGAEEMNGKRIYYWIDIFPPDDTSGNNTDIYTGYETILDGEIQFTLKDPNNSDSPLIIPANYVVFPYFFIDVNDSGSTENGKIDMAMDNLLEFGNINGDMTINAHYPDDFHLSENILVYMSLIYGHTLSRGEVEDLGTVTVDIAKDYTINIENVGRGLLILEGDPIVQLNGSDVLSIFEQPAENEVYPEDMIPFTLRVNTASTGTFSTDLTIYYDDTETSDAWGWGVSPYEMSFSVTAE